MKGYFKWKNNLPSFQGIKIIIFPLFFLFNVFFLNFLIFFITLKFSSNFKLLIFPIISFIGMSFVTFAVKFKNLIIKKLKKNSYQFGFLFFLISISSVASLIIHSSLRFFIFSEDDDFLKKSNLSIYFRIPIFIFFVLLGIRIVFQCFKVFGFDHTLGLYIYFPKESTIINNQIYSFVRHPMYLGFIFISIGSMFLQFSFYSIVSSFFSIISLFYLIFFVEEPDLIQEYGLSFKKYQNEIPAIFFSPSNIQILIFFLFEDDFF